MEKISDYRQLRVWQLGMELVTEIYGLSQEFPREELYGLTSQLRRSAVSIPSNIAEGFKRINFGEKRQFFSIASGSVSELETQITIASNLGFVANEIHDGLLSKLGHISKMLTSLRQRLEGAKNWEEVV